MPGKKKPAAKKSGTKRRTSPAEKKFASDLETRGDAVKSKSPKDKLPPGATHWVEEDKSGTPTVKRGRFSLL
jgi:hypothetical protein